MRFRRGGTAAVVAMGALGALGTAAVADSSPTNRRSLDTEADYSPFADFEPRPTSATCRATLNDPFELPPGYNQQVVADEASTGTDDLWDMNTQNEFGKDAGRYVYRTHETGPDAEVSVTDLKTGQTETLAERADWERFDGIVWTPHGTILAAEEVLDDAVDDPDFPQAEAGLVYELFVDPRDPSELNEDDPRDDVGAQDGIAARPALGSKSHEGMRFDRRGYHYGISESAPGSVYRFIPDRRGDLSEGTLQALKNENGRTGEGRWVTIPDAAAETNAQAAATAMEANGYSRPEDVETGESTGRDRNNGGNTLYVAVTGTDEVLAVDLSSRQRPFAYQYVGPEAGNAAPPEFDSPDNLALDREGNLAITEDPSVATIGNDIFVAAPPSGNDDDDDGGQRHQPASDVERFASLKDCGAEPSGVYFALEGTEEFTEGTPREQLVTDESLFVNRQHARDGTTSDQFVSIAPVDDDDGEEDDD